MMKNGNDFLTSKQVKLHGGLGFGVVYDLLGQHHII